MRSWPAYGAAVCTFAYGALKLYWALGGGFLLGESPLPPEGIAELRTRTPGVLLEHWLSVGLAAVGIVAAFATIRPWGRVFPRWFVLGGACLLAALMLFRAIGQMIGGVQRLTVDPPEALRYTITWDLALWSPFFLVWGLLWAAAAWEYSRRPR